MQARKNVCFSVVGSVIERKQPYYIVQKIFLEIFFVRNANARYFPFESGFRRFI